MNPVIQVYTVFVDTLGVGVIRKNGSHYYSPTRSSVRRLSFLLDILNYNGTAKTSVHLQLSAAPMVQWHFGVK